MKCNKKQRLSGACLSLLAISIQATAQQASPSDADKKSVTADEIIQIQASPLARTSVESAQPISVLSGDELRRLQANSLGETLATMPGINNTHFATVAGSPIVRGLSGARVKTTQNGLDTGDVSRASPDHAITAEASTAQQIEVLRGPATLLYGSGAIGGVINVVDQRIPSERPATTEASIGLSMNSVANQRQGNAAVTTGAGNWAFHADGFIRKSDDYHTPTFTNDEGETQDRVENTFVDAKGATVGTSYFFNRGYLGVSASRLAQQYGIPGHHHDEGEDVHAQHDEVLPFSDMKQNRFSLAGAYLPANDHWQKVEWRYAYTDYQHQEIEGDSAGTGFFNDQHELRVTATHNAVLGFTGAIGLQLEDKQSKARGEEAFAPDTARQTVGVFWVGDHEQGPHHWQLGGRYEHTALDADLEEPGSQQNYGTLSASLGYIFHANEHTALSWNLTHAERAPTGTEVFANGNHFATRTFELGARYRLQQQNDGRYKLSVAQNKLDTEVSNNLDLGAHIKLDDLHLKANLFYNHVNHFIYERFTAINSAELVQNANMAAGLAVVQFSQADVDLYGYELEADWQLNAAVSVHAFSDYTRAQLTDGGNLPRIPPQRLGAALRYQTAHWDSALEYIKYFSQDQVATNETTTDGYNIVNVSVSYYPTLVSDNSLSIYAKVENLTNQLGFVHSSFLKEDAPVSGRNVALGVQISF